MRSICIVILLLCLYSGYAVAQLFVTEPNIGYIIELDLDTYNVTNAWNYALRVVGVAYDKGSNSTTGPRPPGIVFSELSGGVLWHGLDDSNPVLIYNLSEYGVHADRLAIDPTSGNIYFTTIYYIGVLTLDGLHTPLLTGLTNGREMVLAVDESGNGDGYLFYTDYSPSSSHIGRSGMDGTNWTAIVYENIIWPNGLTADYTENKLYFTDGALEHQKIERCNYDGTNREILIQNSGLHFMDILVDDNLLYTTDWTTNSTIQIYDKTSAAYIGSINITGVIKLHSLAINSAYYQMNPGTDVCTERNGLGVCSDICLPSIAADFTCRCDYPAVVNDDDMTCPNTTVCPGIDNGALALDCSRFQYEVCDVTCDKGYGARGTHSKLLCTDGKWNSTEPCADLDECATDPSPCATTGTCENTESSYSCICDPGYTGPNCGEDIDECVQGVDMCADTGTCVNEPGTYSCNCNQGYTDMYCDVDIDECAAEPGPCATTGTCKNSKGSYSCVCDSGYTEPDCGKDYCQNAPCRQNCTFKADGYECSCWAGYTQYPQQPEQCIGIQIGVPIILDAEFDIRLQDSTSPQFQQLATRICNKVDTAMGNSYLANNYIGCEVTEFRNGSTIADTSISLNSSIAESPSEPDGNGFVYPGNVSNIIDNSRDPNDDLPISSIGPPRLNQGLNECVSGDHNCDQICHDATIGFTCSCEDGYNVNLPSNLNECIDIDECADGSHTCGDHACINTNGSFTCSCNDGCSLSLDGKHCEDIDECADDIDACDQICTNTECSFKCSCNEGFILDSDGTSCIDIDECEDQNGGCMQRCVNHPGGYTCSCQYGFLIDPDNNFDCQDVDECAGSPCPNSCVNTDGSYMCSCDLGYVTDNQGNCRAPLLHYGLTAEDASYTGVDDGCAEPITFPAEMPFFSRTYSTLYPCSNGAASLEQYYTSRNPSESTEFYSLNQHKILAPFHTDIDCRNNGTVYYNHYNVFSSNSFHKQNIATVERYIRQFFNIPFYSVQYMVVITWHEVPRYRGYSGRPTSTFQMALVTDWRTSHVIYIYAEDQMKWDINDSSPRLLIGYVMDRALESDIHLLSFTPASYRMDQYAETNSIKGIITYKLADDIVRDTRHTRCNEWYNSLKDTQVIQRPELIQCPCTLELLEQDFFFYEDTDTGAQTRCFITWPHWRIHPNAMKCCYDDTNSWIDRNNGPGGFIFYHPSDYSLLYNKFDLTPRMDCCTGQSSFCHLYRELRPVGQCFSQTPSNFAGLFGDPHILTMDGRGYTFNGWGEYTLLQVNTSDVEFVLQGRTGRAVTLAGRTTDATIFEAFAARDHTNASIHVEIDETKTGLILYGNGIEHTIEYNNSSRPFNYTGESLVLYRIENSLKVLFTAVDISLTINVDIGMLRISLRVDKSLRGQTAGLLGNFDEDPDNDYRFRNGAVLGPKSTEKELFPFGQSWMISENASLFRYFNGLEPRNYSHPDFIPRFLEDEDQNVVAKATQFCGGEKNLACIYDKALTNITDIAVQTNNSDTGGRRNIAVSNNAIPILNSSRRLKANIDEELIAQVEAIDEGAVEFRLTGNAVLSNVTADSATVSWIADTSSDPISVTGTDTLGMTSPALQFEVVLCDGCSGHGHCDYTVVVSVDKASTSFPMAQCVCDTADGIPIWTGLSCDVDFDGCTTSPCSINQECMDLDAADHQQQKKSHQCGPCPDGYEDDGTKCADIDECAGAHNCDQVCINMEQGYTCACHTGYRKLPDNPNQCEDVNECDEALHDCEHRCTNIPGTYTCSCFAGYLLDGNTMCIKDGTVDECALIGKDCSRTAGCTNESGTPECFCVNGYELTADGTECININECQRNVCPQKCSDTEGGFVCSCYAGYKLQDDGVTCQECDSFHWGINCANLCSCGRGVASCDRVHGCVCRTGWTGSTCNTDIDECQTTPSLCPGLHQVCENSDGSFYCACETGYQMTPRSQCEDIDECSDPGLNECQQECSNVPGSFVCSCRAGYVVDSTVPTQCTDLDECEAGIATCEQICENVQGKFNCYCHFGYVLNIDRVTCRKVQDLCATYGGVHCSDICIVDQTSVSCDCPLGYELGSDNQTCKDIDECSSSALNKCSQPDLCTNLLGGYQCLCPTGQFLQNDKRSCKACDAYHYGENCEKLCDCSEGADHCDPVIGCVCRTGWLGQKCDIDLDDCAEDPDVCPGEDTFCTNYAGGYSCQCRDGYHEDKSGNCIDVNECISPLSNTCDQICVNTNGSFTCQCQPGFLHADGKCRDIDECSGLHDCHHKCQNTVGSYRCSCDSGYSLDLSNRKQCIAIDECNSTQQELCHGRNADCAILNLKPTCACWKGYQGDANTEIGCEDTKECEQDPSPCDNVCIEKAGGYSCSCRAGFQLDNDKRSCKECNGGRWGMRCSRTCNCSATSLPGCNKTTGHCVCQPGYHGPFCDEDNNECSDNSVSCPDNSECVNTLGSYRCECHDGYLKSADGICTDIDECRFGLHDCPEYCVNTDGGFTCSCNIGFRLIDNQCLPCPDNTFGTNCTGACACNKANVLNTGRACDKISGTCICKTEWRGAGCNDDVDECIAGTHDCDGAQHRTCRNNEGGYECVCSDGYHVEDQEDTCSPSPDSRTGVIIGASVAGGVVVLVAVISAVVFYRCRRQSRWTINWSAVHLPGHGLHRKTHHSTHQSTHQSTETRERPSSLVHEPEEDASNISWESQSIYNKKSMNVINDPSCTPSPLSQGLDSKDGNQSRTNLNAVSFNNFSYNLCNADDELPARYEGYGTESPVSPGPPIQAYEDLGTGFSVSPGPPLQEDAMEDRVSKSCDHEDYVHPV